MDVPVRELVIALLVGAILWTALFVECSRGDEANQAPDMSDSGQMVMELPSVTPTPGATASPDSIPLAVH